MEKRYQVFISSTFQDLQGARQEVSQALLRADCFPAGMELFPAADEEQFEFIKTVIDQSDYYILISAGRYGSIHPETGLSYTEMEYDYAVETGKPVIRLLHKDPFKELKGEFIERSDEGRSKLEAFRIKLTNGKLVNYWDNEHRLGLLVREGLEVAKKRFPAYGWIRSKTIAEDPFSPIKETKTTDVEKAISEKPNVNRLHDFLSDIESYPEGLENIAPKTIASLTLPAFEHISISDLICIFLLDGGVFEEQLDLSVLTSSFRLDAALKLYFLEQLIDDGLVEYKDIRVQQGFFTIDKKGHFFTKNGTKLGLWLSASEKQLQLEKRLQTKTPPQPAPSPLT